MKYNRMKIIELVAKMEKIDDVLMTYVDLQGVHPVLSTDIIAKVKGLTSLVRENPCGSLLSDLDELSTEFNIELQQDEIKDKNYNFNEMYDYISDLKEKLSSIKTHIDQLKNDIQKYQDALIQIQNINSLDLALEDLFACEFVFFRFGRIPNDSLDKVKLFYNKPFVFRSFSKDHHMTWCMYYTTAEYKREVDNIFSSLLFERIMIPDFVHGKPSEAVEALEAENKNIQKMIDNYQGEVDGIIKENIDKLNHLKGELLFLERVFEARKYVVGMGMRFSIVSFVKDAYETEFKKAFESLEDVELEEKDAYGDGRIQPPKRIKDDWFTIK